MATTATHSGTTMTKSTRTAWFMTALQFAYVIWFGVCVWVALARAAHFAGHFYIPSQGDSYTDSANVWAGWSSGFIQPMMTTVMLQPLVAFASIVASTWQLAQKRTRNNRVLFWLLLMSAVLVFATFVLANVPAGKSISGWILD